MKRIAKSAPESARTSVGKAAEDLHALSRRGTWELILFLAISTAFFSLRGLDLLAPLGESWRVLLGTPPSPDLTTLAVTGYTTSAAILILGRTVSGARPSLKWSHLFFRTVFFPFYLFANALAEHFLAVFVAGLVLIGLEHLNLLTWSMKAIPGGKELFGKL